MYMPGPTAAEAAAWGLTLDEADGAVIEVWPDCVRAVVLFDAVSTQWRVGMSGAIGLDYNVLFRKMDRMHLSEVEYDELEADIRVMELEALSTMRDK